MILERLKVKGPDLRREWPRKRSNIRCPAQVPSKWWVQLHAPLDAVRKEVAKLARSAQIGGAILPSYHFQFTTRVFWPFGGEIAIKLDIDATSHEVFVLISTPVAGVQVADILISKCKDTGACGT